jgi:4-hydroxybenzoate polyprenyltransferase
LLSSGVYAWNDIFDRAADAANPNLRGRPIPSGRVRIAEGALLGTILLVGGMLVGFAHGRGALFVGAAYIILNILNALYNGLFRHRPIVDVVCIAMGFVLRAIAGGVAINVPVSVWLIVCTFMLCVFLGLIKRRAEVVTMEQQVAQSARPVHAFYTLVRLDHMLGVSAGLAVITYTSYCLVGKHSPGVHMVWTIPIVLYGMFRLYSLAVGSRPAGPVELIKRDRVMWLVALLWLAVVLLVMQTKDLPELSGWIGY